jgi:hypothetical protein
MKRHLPFALIILFVVAGCITQERARHLQSDNDLRANLSQIQAWIPTNSSVADVERIMELHGFGCLVLTNLPDGSGSVLCICDYSNTERSVCLTVTKVIPVIAYEETFTPVVVRPK